MWQPGHLLRKSLTIISVLLCMGTIVLWVRSYWRIDSLMIFRVHHRWTTTWIDRRPITLRSGSVYEADSRRGSLRLLFLYNNWAYLRANYPPLWSSTDDVAVEPWAPATGRWAGFAVESRAVSFEMNADIGGAGAPPRVAYTVHALYTPWALWTFLTALLPLAALWGWRRRLSRTRKGLCSGCGYSLSGNVSGVCPECGQAIINRLR